MSIDRDGVVEVDESAEHEIAWDAVGRIDEGRDHIFLTAGVHGLVIPKASFERPEKAARFLAKPEEYRRAASVSPERQRDLRLFLGVKQ